MRAAQQRVTQDDHVLAGDHWIVDRRRDQPDVVHDLRLFDRDRVRREDHVFVAHLKLGRQEIACGIAEIDIIDDRNNWPLKPFEMSRPIRSATSRVSPR